MLNTPPSGSACVGPQASRVASWGKPELPSVFATELRCAVVAYAVSRGGDVVRPVEEQQARFLQADLLLERDRAESGDGVEVAVKRGCAHAAGAGEVRDAERLVVVLADPADRATDICEAAVGQSDLAHALTQRTGDQPPEDLALDHRHEDVAVAWAVEQAHHAHDGVEELVRGVGDTDARGRWRGASGLRPCVCLQEQRGDG